MIQQYTTPTLTLTLETDDVITVEVIQASKLYVTLKQGNFELTKEVTADENVISLFLTQQETSKFKDGNVYLQVRGVTETQFAWATNKYIIGAESVLHKGVINYG